MSQGVPLLSEHLSLPYCPCIDGVLLSLTNRQQMQLAGNAINACVAACITMWVIGNLGLHSDHSGIGLTLASTAQSHDPDGDDEPPSKKINKRG